MSLHGMQPWITGEKRAAQDLIGHRPNDIRRLRRYDRIIKGDKRDACGAVDAVSKAESFFTRWRDRS